MAKFNQFQAAVCKTYGGGDYAHMIEEETPDFESVGDTLFVFLMRELADENRPRFVMDRATAVQRMETACHDIELALKSGLMAQTPQAFTGFVARGFPHD